MTSNDYYELFPPRHTKRWRGRTFIVRRSNPRTFVMHASFDLSMEDIIEDVRKYDYPPAGSFARPDIFDGRDPGSILDQRIAAGRADRYFERRKQQAGREGRIDL